MKKHFALLSGLAVLSTALLSFTDIQEEKQDIPVFKSNQYDIDHSQYLDTVPKKPRTIDLDKELDELRYAEEQLEKALKEIDWNKLEQEISAAMKKIDHKKIQAHLDEAMKEIDKVKLEKEISEAMAKVDWEKMEKEMQRVKEIEFPKIQKELEKLQVELKEMKPELEKELEKAKKEIEKARKEREKEMQ